MMWKKLFSKSPSPETSFSEETKLFEDAVKAILNGSTPWKVQELSAAISSGAFTVAEQKHLSAFVDQSIHEKKKEIMRVALVKILTGNDIESELFTKVNRLGNGTQEKQKGIVTASLDQYMQDKLLWQEEEMRKKMAEYQNVTQYSKFFDAGNAVQQRIEKPFSSK